MKRCAALLCLIAIPALAISPPDASRAARDYRTHHEREIVAEFMELLAIPNLASDTTNIEKNANALVNMFTRRGAEVRLLRLEGAPPLVYATLPGRNAKTTIAFYAHYDGQPVDPAQWKLPPWQPVLRNTSGETAEVSAHIDPESRIYARSASDDKAPIMAMLAALDALKAVKATPSVNLKFVLEGEEEAGSP
ncbi:MAG TPA: M20/M25/M40 family metallo-hydrolase, partial [Thermoanaerobaculia bacterium]